MVVGLQPLEFTECLTDSPQFRENLHRHEKELDKTSQQIKKLIKEVKDLIAAAKRLSTAQQTLAQSLEQFEFECIGQGMTEDEVIISKSLAQFASLIKSIEDERERMLSRAYDQIIQPLEKFRKEHIGAVKEGKKKFEKKTAKFCQSQERNLNLSTKKQDNVFQEADALMDMAERDFCQASLEYVFLLQAVQERKKFEFVEILLGFIYGWLTFYHQGHEIHQDAKPYMSDLQLRLQKTRSNFEETSKKTESLMKKMMEVRQMNQEESNRTSMVVGNSDYTRAGYLFLMEKKAFGTTWTKQYCTYRKSIREFKLTPFNQMHAKSLTSQATECLTVSACVRRPTDSIDKRFCFDIYSQEKPTQVYTLQALSESDRKGWLDALDGREPTYEHQKLSTDRMKTEEVRILDEVGFQFVQRLIQVLENRGLEEQGLYRVTGVASKVQKLLSMGLDRRKGLPQNLDDPLEWESKTITSALKNYLRTMPEPLMTFRYHNSFIAAAKQENREQRLADIHTLVHRLPKQHFQMLEIVIRHLTKVASKSSKNLMCVSNLAVCFGPTLLRPAEETVASIMDLKFYNVVVEVLLQNFDRIFRSQPAINAQSVAVPQTAIVHSNGMPPPPARAQPRLNAHQVGAVQVKSYYDGPLNSSNNHRNSRGYSPPLCYAAHQNQILQHFATPINTDMVGESSLMDSTSSSNESVSSLPTTSSNTNLNSSNISNQLPHYAPNYRPQHHLRVRTLYACLGESEGELSFEPNQIITNVKSSAEPGWLEGTLNGKTGLVPENYVEALP